MTRSFIKQATFLSYERKPEVNISQERSFALSQIFKPIVSAGEKIL